MTQATARDVDIGWPMGLRGSEDIGESITTAAAYADVLDLSCKGFESLSIDINCPAGSDSVIVTAIVKESDYDNGQNVTLTGYPVTLAAGQAALVKRETATARLVIQGKDASGGTPGTVQIVGHINRL